jgi:hypothetical protein
LANNRVAIKISKVLPKCSMLRNHPPPVNKIYRCVHFQSMIYIRFML